MADLAKKLDSLDDKLSLSNTKINSLFWVDDIVLFAKTDKKLTEMINLISQYCQENKLTINCKKTKCLTFNRTGRVIRQNFFLTESC